VRELKSAGLLDFLLGRNRSRYDYQGQDLFSRMFREVKEYFDEVCERMRKEDFVRTDQFLREEHERFQMIQLMFAYNYLVSFRKACLVESKESRRGSSDRPNIELNFFLFTAGPLAPTILYPRLPTHPELLPGDMASKSYGKDTPCLEQFASE
jgi:hypothetical protein